MKGTRRIRVLIVFKCPLTNNEGVERVYANFTYIGTMATIPDGVLALSNQFTGIYVNVNKFDTKAEAVKWLVRSYLENKDK